MTYVAQNLASASARQTSADRVISRSASQRSARSRRTNRRGVIFVTALWVVLILGVMTLLYARSMRTEVYLSSNRAGAEQANAIEFAAENYVLGIIDGFTPGNTVSNTPGDAIKICQASGEAIQVGNSGYFWLLHSNPDDLQNYYYGIVDETSKRNLNGITSDELLMLPNMTADITPSIVSWAKAASTGNTSNTSAIGADSSYYQSLQRPYNAKNAPMESVEELLLIQYPQIDETVVWGGDLNHNGVLDTLNNKEDASTTFSSTGVDGSCGIYPFVTVWGTTPNTDSTGAARTNVSTPTTGGQQPGQQPQPNQALIKALTTVSTALPTPLTQQRATQIARVAAGQTFTNVFDFANKTRVTPEELKQIMDILTTSTAKTSTGLININTVSKNVLQSLTGLQPGDADTIIATRQGLAADSVGGSGMEWMVGTIDTAKLAQFGKSICGRSYQYSADIVAVTTDGRSYKRVRIVVDCQTSPAKIIYRKDLTGFGWPLPQEIKDAMQNGTFQPGSTAPGQLWQP